MCVALGIQQANAYAMLSPVAFRALQYFSALSQNWHDYRGIGKGVRVCIDFSAQLLSQTFLILRRTVRDIITNVHSSASKVPVILDRFERNLNFLGRYLKNTQVPDLKKNPFGGSRDVPCGQTDGYDEANSRLSQFCERAEKPPS